MEIITAWKKLLSYWSHCVHTAGGSDWKTKVKKNEKQRPAGSYFWCLSCIKSYYLSLCFILGERLFSPCTSNKITKLAPHWMWTSCHLLQKTTSDLNTGTFISWNISGSEIQPLRRKGVQRCWVMLNLFRNENLLDIYIWNLSCIHDNLQEKAFPVNSLLHSVTPRLYSSFSINAAVQKGNCKRENKL